MRGSIPDEAEAIKHPDCFVVPPTAGLPPGLSTRRVGDLAMTIQVFFRDIKLEHSVFALPFAYLGLFLAEGAWPRPRIFFWVSVAMVSFRTFGMAWNRLVDRDIDSKNPRTGTRALPKKELTLRFVQTGAFISLAIFLTSTWLLGPLCLLLAPVPMILAVIYPYLKRFTWLSHAVLGIILGISPYGAWLAARPEFSWIPGFLLIGVAGWVAGFDIFYSLQDFDFDRRSGLVSLPVRFGKSGALWGAALLHGLAVAAWILAGQAAGLGLIFKMGLAIVALFLFWEHWLLHRFGLVRINQAFFTMNACVSILIFLSAAVDLLKA